MRDITVERNTSIPIRGRQFLYIDSRNNDSSKKEFLCTDRKIILGDKINYSKRKKRGGCVVVIGDTIDTEAENTRGNICEELLGCNEHREVFDKTARLGGWWVVITNLNGTLTIHNDAAGLLPIYYYDSDYLIAGSTPKGLAELAGIDKNPALVDKLNDEKYFSKGDLTSDTWLGRNSLRDTSWPLRLTPYKGVKHLTPNKFVEADGSIKRIWPRKEILNKDITYVSKTVTDRICKTIENASKLYGNLKFPLSSGLDSRVIFSCALKSSVDFECYSWIIEEFDHDGMYRDAATAKDICSKYGIEHKVLNMSSKSTFYYKEITKDIDFYVSSNTLPYEHSALKEFVPSGGVVFNGSVSEVGRPLYAFGNLPYSLVTPDLLANINGHKPMSFVRNEFKSWFVDAKDVNKKYNVDLMDLLYWEERMGSWQSSYQQQLRSACPVISPFNCRLLLEELLSVEYTYRLKSKIHYDIIKSVDPHLLSFPVNPTSNNLSKIKKKIKYCARKSKITNYAWWKLRNLR